MNQENTSLAERSCLIGLLLVALEGVAENFILVCSASGCVNLFILMAVSVAVIRSTTGSCCGEMAKFSALACFHVQ